MTEPPTKPARLPRSQPLPDRQPEAPPPTSELAIRNAVADQAIALIEQSLANEITTARRSRTEIAALAYLALQSIRIELLGPVLSRQALTRAVQLAHLPDTIATESPWPLTRHRLWIHLIQEAAPGADQLMRFAAHLASLVEIELYREGSRWPQPVVAAYLISGEPPAYDTRQISVVRDYLADALKTPEETQE